MNKDDSIADFKFSNVNSNENDSSNDDELDEDHLERTDEGTASREISESIVNKSMQQM